MDQSEIENKDSFIDWKDFSKECLKKLGLGGESILQVEGPSQVNPHKNHKIELINI
jgi:hypothetical protein